MSFESTKVRVAAKYHTCDRCDGVIEPGEKYERHVKHNGDFQVKKTHVNCKEESVSYQYKTTVTYVRLPGRHKDVTKTPKRSGKDWEMVDQEFVCDDVSSSYDAWIVAYWRKEES